MTILVLANIGSRDVELNGGKIIPARSEGERLLTEYPAKAGKLTFPIIEPVLRYLLKRHLKEQFSVFLFGTDQPEIQFQPTDTLYFTRLMERRLPEILGERVSVRVVDVQGFNPSYYDHAIDAYDRLVAGLPREDISTCYVALAGGIPACNTALLLQGVRHYGGRLQVLYTPQGGEPQPIRAGQQMLVAFREAAAIEHLERLDFANAHPYLKELNVGPGLQKLVEYAARRLDFDFSLAQQALEEAAAQGDAEIRLFANEFLRHDLDSLLGENDSPSRLRALLLELNWNAAICWKHRRYADFLARVYRFQEAVLRYLVEIIYRLPTDMGPNAIKTTRKLWEEGIQARPALMEFFKNTNSQEQKLDWRVIGRVTYKAMLSFAVNENLENPDALLNKKDRPRYAGLLDRVNALDRMVDLRHRTIVGHDFEGVSEQVVSSVSPKKKESGILLPPDALDEIVSMIVSEPGTGCRAKPNPYEQVARFVIPKLQRGR